MKKGQVTIFILIFVVLLIGFGFVFYLLNQVAQDTTRSSQQALIEEIKAKTTLEQQMKECLNVGLKRGLRLIGSQGGFIYKDQQVTDPYYGLLKHRPTGFLNYRLSPHTVLRIQVPFLRSLKN